MSNAADVQLCQCLEILHSGVVDKDKPTLWEKNNNMDWLQHHTHTPYSGSTSWLWPGLRAGTFMAVTIFHSPHSSAHELFSAVVFRSHLLSMLPDPYFSLFCFSIRPSACMSTPYLNSILSTIVVGEAKGNTYTVFTGDTIATVKRVTLLQLNWRTGRQFTEPRYNGSKQYKIYCSSGR